MNLKDYAMFRKLLQMTLSSNDGEALTAIRKANGLLLADNKNWEELLDNKVSVSTEASFTQEKWKSTKPEEHFEEPEDDPEEHTIEHIEHMFQTLIGHEVVGGIRPGSFRDMVEDIYYRWQQTNHLTKKQFKVIKNAYMRETQPSPYERRR